MPAQTQMVDGTKKAQMIRAAEVPETYPERTAILREALAGNAKLETQAIACIRKYPGETIINYGRTVSPVLDLIAEGNAVLREVLAQEAKAKAREIAGPNPTPLESLLVDRVVTCWLQVSHFERIYAKHLSEGMTTTLCESMQKRISSAHKRYLSSIKALAQIRRLQLPPVQINVGDQQINVGDRQVNIGEQQVNTR